MLMDYIDMNFGTFPKAKYNLYINRKLIYFFVTTTKPEEDCIPILRKMAKEHMSKLKYVKITKIIDGKETIIFKKCFTNY